MECDFRVNLFFVTSRNTYEESIVGIQILNLRYKK